MSNLISCEALARQRLRASASCISFPGRYLMVTSYLCSSSSILWRRGGAFTRFFMAIISSGLWSLSATKLLPSRYVLNLWQAKTMARSSSLCWNILYLHPWGSCWQRRSAGPYPCVVVWGRLPAPSEKRLLEPSLVDSCRNISQCGVCFSIRSWLAERTVFVDRPSETRCPFLSIARSGSVWCERFGMNVPM